MVEVWAVADDLKDNILSIFEAALGAQLRAVRRLRQAPAETAQTPRHKGMSQVDMAYDILKRARSPLHVSAIIERIEQAGLVFSGTSPDGVLMEIAELPKKAHPFMLGTQFHPELTARPLTPHPLFTAFLKAAKEKGKK